VSGEKVRNSHVVIDGKGDITAVYQKAHLFDLNIPERGIRLMESDYVIPGQMILPPIETPIGNLGLSVVSFYDFLVVSTSVLTFYSLCVYIYTHTHTRTIYSKVLRYLNTSFSFLLPFIHYKFHQIPIPSELYYTTHN
jgi:hypothetical protein